MKSSKFSWKGLFGKSKKSSSTIPPTSNNDKHQQLSTLERLREMEDLLKRKQSHLETRIQEEIAEARKQGTKNKRAALNALKRKRRLEAELTRLDGTLTTIEMQRESLESAKNNLQVLGAMKDAATVLKNAQKHVTVDKVLDIMDEVNEQQDVAKEIADAISNPLGAMASTVDDEELEKELEALEQEELNKALLNVNIGSTSEEKEEPTSTPTPGEEAKNKAKEDIDAILNTFSFSMQAGQNQSPTEEIGGITVDEKDPDAQELRELAQWSS